MPLLPRAWRLDLCDICTLIIYGLFFCLVCKVIGLLFDYLLANVDVAFDVVLSKVAGKWLTATHEHKQVQVRVSNGSKKVTNP